MKLNVSEILNLAIGVTLGMIVFNLVEDKIPGLSSSWESGYEDEDEDEDYTD